MSISVAEQIVRKVKTRLAAISTDDGYETTASQVVRPARLETSVARSYSLYIESGNLTKNQQLSHPGNPPAQCWELPVIVRGVVRPSDDDTTPADFYRHQFWADVIKAASDATGWWTWDQLAIDTHFSQVEQFRPGDGNGVGFAMTILILFRTSENDPYTVRA